VANSTIERFVGLMGKKDLSQSFLLIPKCRSVHTFFMRGPIDLAFLDTEGRVIVLKDSVRPWRLVFGTRKSEATLELPAGYLRAKGIQPGDQIECQQN